VTADAGATPDAAVDAAPAPVKQACAMHIHRTNDHEGGGCGPGKSEQFHVFIAPTAPALKNGANASDPVLHNPAQYPFVMSGAYGDKLTGCQGGRSEVNQSAWVTPDWVHPVSPAPTYTQVPGLSVAERMPHTYDFQGYTYHLMTQGSSGAWDFGGPGSDCEVYSETFSPLMIDLGGNGITLSAPSDGPIFDLSADGVVQHYSWPVWGKATGGVVFLAFDRNGNGAIDDIEELFGNNTTGPDGKKSANGFDALAKYDANLDGQIDAKDVIYTQLVVWADRNSNGKTDAQELQSLGAAGIARIDLHYQGVTQRLDSYGNESQQRSQVTRAGGGTASIFDVWLTPY
jgi:hypothetical protein